MIAFLLSPLGRLLGVGALSGLMFGILGTYAGFHWEHTAFADYKAQVARADADRSAAALAAFEDTANRMNNAAQAYALNQTIVAARVETIIKDLQHVQAKAPLPSGCKPDDGRVRSLSDSIDAANAAAGH